MDIGGRWWCAGWAVQARPPERLARVRGRSLPVGVAVRVVLAFETSSSEKARRRLRRWRRLARGGRLGSPSRSQHSFSLASEERLPPTRRSTLSVTGSAESCFSTMWTRPRSWRSRSTADRLRLPTSCGGSTAAVCGRSATRSGRFRARACSPCRRGFGQAAGSFCACPVFFAGRFIASFSGPRNLPSDTPERCSCPPSGCSVAVLAGVSVRPASTTSPL